MARSRGLGDVYKRQQLYFPQFMHHAEILEPEDLRAWFKEKFNKVATLYNQNN
jgi:hypothetical protein